MSFSPLRRARTLVASLLAHVGAAFYGTAAVIAPRCDCGIVDGDRARSAAESADPLDPVPAVGMMINLPGPLADVFRRASASFWEASGVDVDAETLAEVTLGGLWTAGKCEGIGDFFADPSKMAAALSLLPTLQRLFATADDGQADDDAVTSPGAAAAVAS
jgi:hypothetical protein